MREIPYILYLGGIWAFERRRRCREAASGEGEFGAGSPAFGGGAHRNGERVVV
jgi:hypothetical protein